MKLALAYNTAACHATNRKVKFLDPVL